MTVTTGARGLDSKCACSPTSASKASGSSCSAANALWPISSTRIMAVSWSSTWLMVHIWPNFIKCLMTSDALTDILCANSATVIVSGTCTSLTTASVGAWKFDSRSSWCDGRRPFAPPRQLSRPAGPLLPRGLGPPVVPRFFASSDQVDDTLADLIDFLSATAGFLSPGFSPGFLSAGLCSVPSGAFGLTGAGAGSGALMARRGAFIMALIWATSSATALRARSVASAFSAASLAATAAAAAFFFASSAAAAFFASAAASSATAGVPAAAAATTVAALAAAFLASASASFLAANSACCVAFAWASFSASSLARRSCFSRRSASWRAISSACLRASSSRRATSAGSITGAAGAAGAGAATGSSRCTKVRVFFTATWMVRLLPEASACLISEVSLRVRVIFFFSVSAAEPWVRRRWFNSLSLSSFDNGSDVELFSTPAERSCVSSKSAGIFSSVANWATLLLAIQSSFLCVAEMIMIRKLSLGHFCQAPGFRLQRLGAVVIFCVDQLHLVVGHIVKFILDQFAGTLARQRQDCAELVVGQGGELLHRLDACQAQLACRGAVHAFQANQRFVHAFQTFFGSNRLRHQGVAGTGAQFVDRVFVEGLDVEHLRDGHVGNLFQRGKALFHQDVGHFLVDVEFFHEQGAHCRGFRRCLVLGLFGRHDVDLPASQFSSQAHVLARTADRNRQVFFIDHHVHGVLFFIDDDGRDIRGSQGANDELGRIIRPQHDVDALATEFTGDSLHARTAHADAGADRVDALVRGVDGDFCTHARIAGSRFDLQQALLDFRHFQLEQLHNEVRRGARQDHLGTTHIAVDAQNKSTDAVADAQVFLRDHLITGQAGFDLAGFDDGVTALHALDGAGDERIAALEEVHQDLLALGVTHALQDDLFGVLGEAAAEFDGLDGLFDVFVHFDIGDLFHRFEVQDFLVWQLQAGVVRHHVPAAEGFELARIAVDRHANVDFAFVTLFRGLGQGEFERAEDDILIDVFFARQRIYQ